MLGINPRPHLCSDCSKGYLLRYCFVNEPSARFLDPYPHKNLTATFDDRSNFGAGEGNRTLVLSLGSFRSTIELHPQSIGVIIMYHYPECKCFLK